ncbi:YrhB domain-containing protein [Curtobacterium citreum]|uniref:YrhB domain-containing protein n=1 Tax=Curtobacterium citreum TaxID=2036 RepID=UPI0034D6AE8F
MRTLKDAQDEFAKEVRADEDLIWDRGWIETDDWWIVLYDSREYYETQNPLFSLAGNVPFVAPKDGGVCFTLQTNTSVEAQIEERCQRVISRSR